MRPLRLRMSGLRSYRSEVTIDFGDPGLIAIVGDTGAGKSSILEALFFVLYGGCTWDQRAVVPLMSDGATVMQVELEFVAEDRRWRVFRSASRSGAQSRHELECLDDPATRFDNDGPVTDEVKRLVGLDPDAFLRTVILPQGRFQALLQATRADRTAILKGIFRLDQLADARERADTAARRLRPGAQHLKEQRAAMLPDPQSALTDAQRRRDQAQARHGILKDLSGKIAAAASERDNAGRQASELQAREQQVRATMVPGASTDLANFAATARRLEEQCRQVETRREQHRQTATSLRDVLDRADDRGEGIEALAAAAATVESLAEELPRLIDDEARCEQTARAVAALAESANAKKADADTLIGQAAEARSEQERLGQASTTASEHLAEAKKSLAVARDRGATYTDRKHAAREAAEGERVALQGIGPATERARTTAQNRDAAQQALEAVRRASAAAHAAEGCQPGDSCPICQRPLPDGFRMAPPPGEGDAQARLAEADQAAASAANALATQESDAENAANNRERADREAQQAKDALDRAVTTLRRTAADADLDAADDTLLAPLDQAALAAATAHEQQTTATNELIARENTATAEARTLTQQHQQRSAELRKYEDSVRKRRASWDATAHALPGRYQPEEPITADTLTAVAARINRRRLELAEVKTELEAQQQSLNQADQELETLRRQIRVQVEDPAHQIVIKVTVAVQRLNDLAALLDLPSGSARIGGTLSGDAEWARAVAADTDTALAQARAAAASLEQLRDHAISAIAAALAAAGAEDEQGLDEIISEVLADLQRARQDIDVATEQIPLTAELDNRISQAARLLDALDELTRLLSDAKFIAYVVNRKQQTLLAIATEVLGAMTGGRYGFSETFEIVDRLTGLPRSVKTLSGGETFLASLGIALGLVELAGRGGGRLDALFLDEGFGSLDANSLSEALDALGRQAESGRLVAVISHVRSVAENVDRVLGVSTGPSGSQVRWLGGEERDQLIAEDVEASLLI
jgi:DNA repair protein SbcC/Rad50